MTIRVLVVCTANVCRSPMGEALLQRHCTELGVDVQVTSAGTQRHELPVDPGAVTVMAEQGLDISVHQPRQLDRAVLEADGADLVITMTRDHLRVVATSAPGVLRRSFTAKELGRRLAAVESIDLSRLNEGRSSRDLMGTDPDDDVADPYGQSLQLHRECAAEIDHVMRIVAHCLIGLKWQAGPPGGSSIASTAPVLR